MPSTSTGKKRGKRIELAEWLARERPERIGETEFAAISFALAPVSESYLRKLLRESGVPLAPTVEGVRQADLEELERSLIALQEEYESGNASAARRIVIAAKDHAKWAALKHPEKQEMILWMLTWLENPPLFREWIQIRKRFANSSSA
jgi:hypothetical protein